MAYKIESKMYVIEYISGMTFRAETSSTKGALKKAFEQYKRLMRREDDYEMFKQNTIITEE